MERNGTLRSKVAGGFQIELKVRMKALAPLLAVATLFSSMLRGDASPFEEQTRIAILLAMDEDFRVVSSRGKNHRQVDVGGASVTLMEIDGKKIALAKVGRGPAKAAASALATIVAGDDPWYLFTLTPAGGLCGQAVNQIVIPSRIVEKSNDTTLEVISSVAGDLMVDDGDFQLCSVDAFVSSNENVQHMVEGGNCLVDMNSFWISEVAAGAGTEHIPIRVISDDAGNDAGQQFREFAETYKGEGGELLLKIIQSLPIPKNSAMAHENILSEIKNH